MPTKKTAKKTAKKKDPAKKTPEKKEAKADKKNEEKKEAAESAQPKLISLEEVAKMLKMQPLQVRKLVQRGKIPGVKVDGAWRFNPDLVYSVFHGRSRGR